MEVHFLLRVDLLLIKVFSIERSSLILDFADDVVNDLNVFLFENF